MSRKEVRIMELGGLYATLALLVLLTLIGGMGAVVGAGGGVMLMLVLAPQSGGEALARLQENVRAWGQKARRVLKRRPQAGVEGRD